MSMQDIINQIRAETERRKKLKTESDRYALPGAALDVAAGMPGFSIIKSATEIPQAEVEIPQQKEKMSLFDEAVQSAKRVPGYVGSQMLDMAGFLTRDPVFSKASEILSQRTRHDIPTDAPQISSFDDLKNLSASDIIRYGISEVGQLPASMISMAVPGAGVAKIAPLIGRVAAYSPKVAKFVNYLGGAEKAAQFAGAYTGGTLLEAGSISSDAFRETGEMPERLKVLPWAMAAGALEAAEPIRLIGRFAAKVPREIAEEAVKKSGRGLVNFIVDYAKDMGLEGGTEFIQTILEESGVKNIQGMGAGEALYSTATDPDALTRAGAAGITGLAGGGVAGAPGFASDVMSKKSVPAEPTGKKVVFPVQDVIEKLKEQPTIQQEMGEAIEDDLVERISSLRNKMDKSRNFVDQPEILRDSNALAKAMEKARQAVSSGVSAADVGINTPAEKVKINKQGKKLIDILNGIGISGDMVDQFAVGVVGKPLASLNNNEVSQLIDAAINQAAQGNYVAPQPQQVQPMGINQPPMSQPAMPGIAQREMGVAGPEVALPDRLNMIRELAAKKQKMNQPERMNLPQTPEVTRQITPEDMKPFADQPMVEREATEEELDHLFGDTPEKKAERKAREEKWRKNFESEENMEAMNPDDANPDLFEQGFGKNKNKAYFSSGKITAKDKNGKQRFFEVKLTKDLDTGKITKKIVRGDLTKGQQELDLQEEYKALPAKHRQISDAINGTNSDLYLRKELAKALAVPVGKSHAGNTNYTAIDTLINRRLRDEESAVRLIGKDLYQKIKETGRLNLDEILDEIKKRYLPQEISNVKKEPEFNIRNIDEVNSVEEIKSELSRIIEHGKAIGGNENLSQDVKNYAKALNDKWEGIKAKNTEVLSGQKQPVTKKAYGESNKITSKEAYEAAKARLKAGLKKVTSGVDPTLMPDAIIVGMYHIEAGIRKFADFAKAMIEDIGDGVKPYLASAYSAAKNRPEFDDIYDELESEEQVRKQAKKILSEKLVETKPVKAVSYSRGETNITISADSEGIITIAYEYPRQTDLRYLTDKGQLSPMVDRAWKVPADKVERAIALAKEIDVAEASDNSSEHYRNVIRPIQDKIISLAKDTTTAEVSDLLVPYAKSLLTFKSDNTKLDKALSDAGLDPKSFTRKKAQEALEGAMMKVIRENKLQGDFYQLDTMYKNMPNLNERTGGSMTRQAYSTPPVLADLLAKAAGLQTGNKLSIYEPTAGNGLLLSGVVENEEGTKNTYFLNELDKERSGMLKELFPDAELTSEDATTFKGPDINVDVVITNPPFGGIKPVNVKPMQGADSTITLSKLEHLIAWNALKHMRPDGKAILVLGAEKENKITGARKKFATAIYNQFNITGHFELDGQFYRRMGAEWPIEIYLIDGRKDYPSKKLFKAPESVRRISHAEDWIGVKNYLEENVKPGRYINRPVESDGGRGGRADGRKPAGPSGITSGKSSISSTEKETGPGGRSQPATSEAAGMDERQSETDRQRDNEQGRSETRIERVKRELTDKGETKQEQRRDTTTPVADKPGVDDSGINTDELGVETNLQTSYKPVATGNSINSLAPKNLAKPMSEALKNILKESGEKTLDDYVAKQLGYDGKDDIPFFAAEQIDALAESFWSLNQKGGNIVADQTGLGKGRVAAGAIQWAVENGKIPIFMTEKVGLFNDIYRDLKDIGQGSLRPFMFNADGEMSYEDENGKKQVVYKHKDAVYEEVFSRMLAGDYSDFTGPDRKFDYIALTYSQINQGDVARAKHPILKIDAFNDLSNAVLILDEAHNAAGKAGSVTDDKGGSKRKGDKGPSNQMENVLSMLPPEKTHGVVYLSATWAKTPENVPVYYRAFEQKNLTMDEIQTAFQRGDLAIQEMVVASMANKGRYIRREQSFAGISWRQEQTPAKSAAAAKERSVADRAMASTRNLIWLDGVISEEMREFNLEELNVAFNLGIPDEFISGDAESGSRVASSLDSPDSPFSGVHNYINSFLAAVKADRTADRAIEMIKQGIKPVISVQNTMESHMDNLIAMGEGEIGEGFAGTYADILESKINNLLRITVKHPTQEKRKFSFTLPMEALSSETQEKIRRFRADLKNANLESLPFSPIDYVIGKIKAAGYQIGEITGRGKYIDYNDLNNGRPTLKVRTAKETTTKARREILNKFNYGDLDALIVNSAGATGLSAHSSKTFRDQRQRAMLIMQPFDDINTFTQMLGRIFRTGAVFSEAEATSKIKGLPAKYGKPFYEYIQSSLAMEERPAARLQAKMKSLNANTSSNKEGQQQVSDIDIYNKYGTKVVRRWLMANKDYAWELGYKTTEDINNSSANQVTGRVAILPQQIQNDFWNAVMRDYNDTIEELNALNTNDLIVPDYAGADATTVAKQLVYGKEGSPEAPPVYAETIEMTVPGNPAKYNTAISQTGDGISDAQIEERDRIFDEFINFKEKEIAEWEARTGEKSSQDLNKVRSYAKNVKEMVSKIKPGNMGRGTMYVEMTGADGKSFLVKSNFMGVVTKVVLEPIPDNFVGNPWLPGKIKIHMMSPNESGRLIISGTRMGEWDFTDQGKASVGEMNEFKEDWEKRFAAASTKRVRKMALTGDILKASSMSDDSKVVQMTRRDGTSEFMWLANSLDGDMEIQTPVERLDESDFEFPPPVISSMDADKDVMIGKWVGRGWNQDRGAKKDWTLQQNEAPDDYDIRIRYTSPMRNMLLQDKKLAEILDPKDNDPFVKEKLARNANFMVLKKNISRDKVGAALKRIDELLASKGSGLTNASATDRKVDVSKVAAAMPSSRSGRAGILEIATEWADKKATEILESAFNWIANNRGSFIEWLKTVAEKFRSMASKAWKDAKKIFNLSGRGSGLGRRGGVMNLREIIKNAQQSIAIATDSGKKTLAAGAVEELVQVVSETAYEEGLRTEKATSKKMAAFRRRQADERVAERQEMIDSLRARKKLDEEGRRFLLKLVTKLPIKDRAKLISQITMATTPKRVGAVINRIDELYQRFVTREATARFAKAIKEAQKLRPEFQGLANEIKANPKDRWLAYESLGGIMEYLADDDAMFIPPDAKAAMESLIENKPKRLSPATINMIAQVLESLKHMSDQENKRIFAENTETLKGAVDDIKGYVETQAKIEEGEGLGEAARSFFDIGSMQYEAITETLGETGRKLFYEDLRSGERKAKEIWFEGRDELHNVMRKNGVDPESNQTNEWLSEEVVLGKSKMTRGEYLNLVANLMDSSTRKEVLKAGIRLQDKESPVIMLKESEIDAVINSLDAKEKAIVESMRGFLNGKLKGYVNETWVDLAGYEKALKEDYWPRTRDIKKAGVNKSYQQWAKTALEELGIFKERETSKSPVVIKDIMQVYQNHLKKSSAFAGLAKPIRHIEMAMGKGGLADAIEKQYGKKMVKRIEDQVQAIADLGTPGGGELDSWFRRLLKNISIGFLGFNPRSAMKQFGGLFTAATEIDARLIADSLGSAFDKETQKEMFKYSAILRDRYDSTGAKLVSPTFDTNRKIAGLTNREIRENKAMWLLETFDKAVSQIIWEASKKEISQKNPDLKGEALMREVAKRTEQVVSRTQNVTSILDMSGVALEGRKSAGWKALTMFQSQGNSIYNIVRRNIRDYRAGKIDATTLAGNLAWATLGNSIWSSMAGTIVSGSLLGALIRGGGDEDKEEIRKAFKASEIAFDVARENVQSIYGGSVVSSMMFTVKRMLESGNTFSTSGAKVETVTESVLNKTMQGSLDIIKGVMEKGEVFKSGKNKGKPKFNENVKRGSIKIIKGILPLTGRPYSFTFSEGEKLLSRLYSK